ncbi:hypothetical protein GGS23DRAFT_140899 [Durotheca rogersii]|uniref:uncharacterized protein n=1 Tax=Durotheca rogersii TaxID=419775 RepID=UPI002220F2C5|nr:uncharacterized protein GGS23DRAFT_140899 [Durotheca rogersii]KAI5861594.1 hypothetical protein GGS23DRAFT_140899 [Durotheca rogersii]
MSCTGGIRAFVAKLQSIIGCKSKRDTSDRPALQISAPFNFKHETLSLPGVSEDEIAILKEQAAAARVNYVEGLSISQPRRAPAPPTLASAPISTTEKFF